MRKLGYIFLSLVFLSGSMAFAGNYEDPAKADVTETQAADIEHKAADGQDDTNVPEIIFGHIGDSYQWHITNIGDKHISLYLPVILFSKYSGAEIGRASCRERV